MLARISLLLAKFVGFRGKMTPKKSKVRRTLVIPLFIFISNLALQSVTMRAGFFKPHITSGSWSPEILVLIFVGWVENKIQSLTETMSEVLNHWMRFRLSVS